MCLATSNTSQSSLPYNATTNWNTIICHIIHISANKNHTLVVAIATTASELDELVCL